MRGTSIALVACMFLALEFIFSKVLLDYMSPLMLAAISSSTAAVLLFFILEVNHKLFEIFRLNRREFIALLAVGIISGVIGQLLYVTGLKESTATNAILLTRMNSLLISVMGVLLIREKFHMNHVVGALLMSAGVVIIATKGAIEDLRPTEGDLLLLMAAFCWASANIIMKKYLTRLPPEVIVIGYNAFSGFVLLLFTADQIPSVVMNIQILAYMTGLVVLVSILGRYLWYYSFEHTSACNVGLASLSIPLFGVLYAITLLGERLQAYQAFGGLLIFAGLVSIEYHQLHHHDVRHIEHRLKRHHPHH